MNNRARIDPLLVFYVIRDRAGAGVVIGLERDADLHTAQLMPLPLTVSCFSKIQIGFTFLVPAHTGSSGKGPLNGCVYVTRGEFREKPDAKQCPTLARPATPLATCVQRHLCTTTACVQRPTCTTTLVCYRHLVNITGTQSCGCSSIVCG